MSEVDVEELLKRAEIAEAEARISEANARKAEAEARIQAIRRARAVNDT